MTFQRLCNLVTQGELNYYSKVLEILIEPLYSDSQTDYRLTVHKDKQVIEVVDVTPPPVHKVGKGLRHEWKNADECRDKILLEKNRLHIKHVCA